MDDALYVAYQRDSKCGRGGEGVPTAEGGGSSKKLGLAWFGFDLVRLVERGAPLDI